MALTYPAGTDVANLGDPAGCVTLTFDDIFDNISRWVEVLGASQWRQYRILCLWIVHGIHYHKFQLRIDSEWKDYMHGNKNV